MSVKRALRIDDAQHQARKARAGADVGQPVAAQVGLQAQTVEHMLSQHAGAIADRGQIELSIAPFELIHEREQRFGALRIQFDPEVSGTVDEHLAFSGAHGAGAC